MAVTKSEMASLPKICAVDVDGTLVKDAYPELGEPIWFMIQICKILQAHGVKLIMWTCRNGKHLREAVEFFSKPEIGLRFDAVNENIPEVIALFGGDTRKVYANLYLDDKARFYLQDPIYWSDMLGVDCSAFRELNRRLYSQMA